MSYKPRYTKIQSFGNAPNRGLEITEEQMPADFALFEGRVERGPMTYKIEPDCALNEVQDVSIGADKPVKRFAAKKASKRR